MGERAAKRTNQLVGRLSGMYVGKNFGYSRQRAEAHERVFGAGRPGDAAEPGRRADERKDVLFGEGSLGMEIVWGFPPVVAGVAEDGAASRAGVRPGDVIVEVNGADVAAFAEYELDELARERPLRLVLAPALAAGDAPPPPAPAAVVLRQGVAVAAPGALSAATCEAVAAFAAEERGRCAEAVEADASAAGRFFSEVQVPRAAAGAPETRWDLRLPMAPPVRAALEECLWGGEAQLGLAFEALAGADAELWELGVVASEPGAAPQPVHFDAPARCLFTAFVALQEVTGEMGPTLFLPGTNASAAHRDFVAGPAEFIAEAPKTLAKLGAGDALLYDARVLHCGGPNRSDKRRLLMYITFRDPSVDPARAGVEQHSVRPEVAGRYRLSDFRRRPE